MLRCMEPLADIIEHGDQVNAQCCWIAHLRYRLGHAAVHVGMARALVTIVATTALCTTAAWLHSEAPGFQWMAGSGTRSRNAILRPAEFLQTIRGRRYATAVNGMVVPDIAVPLPLPPALHGPFEQAPRDARTLYQVHTAPALTGATVKVTHTQEPAQPMTTALRKYIYLADLKQADPKAFYRLLLSDLPQTLPFVYTPTVGDACQQFNTIFQNRKVPGLYVRYTDRGHIREVWLLLCVPATTSAPGHGLVATVVVWWVGGGGGQW